MERKCIKCGHWNDTINDFCAKCSTPISPNELRKIDEQKREKQESEKPKSRIDLIVARVKNSKNPFVQMFYWVCYSLWMVHMAVITFFLWFIALGPG